MVRDPFLYVILWIMVFYGIFMIVMVGRHGHGKNKAPLALMCLTGVAMTCMAAFLLVRAVTW